MFPSVDVGDHFTTSAVGVMTYEFARIPRRPALRLSPDRSAEAYDVVHVNSEFADQASDHDPSVSRVKVLGGGGG